MDILKLIAVLFSAEKTENLSHLCRKNDKSRTVHCFKQNSSGTEQTHKDRVKPGNFASFTAIFLTNSSKKYYRRIETRKAQ